jgi:hypothetical protein
MGGITVAATTLRNGIDVDQLVATSGANPVPVHMLLELP